MTITTVRGNTIVAAANAATNLAVLGADTGATPLRTPPGMNSIVSMRCAYASNGATVGASVAVGHLICSSGEYWFLMGASGGQNATGEGNSLPPSDPYELNIPVTPGEALSTLEVFVQITDDGTQAAIAEVTFGSGASVSRSYMDVRVGQATALNTGVAMLTRGASTAAGPFTVPGGVSRIAAVHTVGACTFAAVNSSTCSVILQGDGLEGGTQAFAVGAAGSTLATTGVRAVPVRKVNVNAKIAPNSTIAATIFLGGVDNGEYSGGIGLQYA